MKKPKQLNKQRMTQAINKADKELFVSALVSQNCRQNLFRLSLRISNASVPRHGFANLREIFQGDLSGSPLSV